MTVAFHIIDWSSLQRSTLEPTHKSIQTQCGLKYSLFSAKSDRWKDNWIHLNDYLIATTVGAIVYLFVCGHIATSTPWVDVIHAS